MLQINVETFVRGRCPALQCALSVSTQLSITICWNINHMPAPGKYLALLTQQYYTCPQSSIKIQRQTGIKLKDKNSWTANEKANSTQQVLIYTHTHIFHSISSCDGPDCQQCEELTNFKLNTLVLSQLWTTITFPVWDQAHLWAQRCQNRARA